MKKKFINSSLKYIESQKNLTDLDRKKLKYGLEGFYNLMTKFIVLIILATIFNLIPELILLTIIYGFLRLYGFGLHIIWIFGFISFILFAPSDTKARPLIHKEKRIRAKIFSIIIVIVLYIINLYLNNSIFLNTSLYALFIQSLVMNPLVYKIFNAPYNNYKTFDQTTV